VNSSQARIMRWNAPAVRIFFLAARCVLAIWLQVLEYAGME